MSATKHSFLCNIQMNKMLSLSFLLALTTCLGFDKVTTRCFKSAEKTHGQQTVDTNLREAVSPCVTSHPNSTHFLESREMRQLRVWIVQRVCKYYSKEVFVKGFLDICKDVRGKDWQNKMVVDVKSSLK